MLDGLFHLLNKVLFFTSLIKNRSSFPKPLSLEEEKENFAKYRAGNREAYEILVHHNMRLVVHISRKYTNSAEADDLQSVGTIGLIKAVNTFEYEKGTQFATFAARCIENEMLMLLRNNKKNNQTVSINDTIGTDKDGNVLTYMDLLFVNEESVFKQVENKIVREKIIGILKRCLSEREYTIICYRYGLSGKRMLTQREIAKTLYISRSYISRIEKKALEKLKDGLRGEQFQGG